MDAWRDGSTPPVPGFPSSRRVPYLCLKMEAFVVVSACFLSRSLKCGTVATLGFVLGSCPLWHSEGHYDTRDYTQAASKVCALCRAIYLSGPTFTHCLHVGLPPLANDHLRSVSFEFGILLDAANKCSLREFVFVSHLLFLNMFLFNMELSPTL